MYGVLIITNVPVQSLTKKAVISYGADLHQVEVLMLHWGCRTIVKAASRVMAWLGNSRLSAQHCIVRNQSINNCYSMFMCHVSMTKRSHLIIRVLKMKEKMTNNKYFCLVVFFYFKCMVGKHSLLTLTGIPLTRIQAQNTINMKNPCTLFNSIHRWYDKNKLLSERELLSKLTLGW